MNDLSRAGRWLLWMCLPAVLQCDRSGGEEEDETGVLQGGELVFEDDFERDEPGDHWSARGEAWTIRDGALFVEGAQNDALWLDVPLPEAVRVEFEVTALHPHGDLKFEIFGDGTDHESGYILIYGGWQNTVTCIARLDEHGSDRLDASQHTPVEQDRAYRFAAVRTDDRLRWYIDSELVLTFDDGAPLRGDEHRFLAFNDWAVPVRFDNLRIYDLGQ